MICTMLDFLDLYLWISVVLNNMFVSGLWFSKHTILSTVIMFSPVRIHASVCSFHAFGLCCMFPKSLLMTFPLFPCCSLFSKILPVFAENRLLNQCKFLIRAMSPLLNGTLHHWYIVSAKIG